MIPACHVDTPRSTRKRVSGSYATKALAMAPSWTAPRSPQPWPRPSLIWMWSVWASTKCGLPHKVLQMMKSKILSQQKKRSLHQPCQQTK